MGKFRKYLETRDEDFILESEESLFKEISDIVAEMESDEIDEFGYYLAQQFFDTTLDAEDDYIYDAEAVLDMIKELGEDFYPYVLEMLTPEDELDDEMDYEGDEDSELEEGVSKSMKTKNLNRSKRKFFTKSLATLRQEKPERMKQNRISHSKRRTYQKINKEKLQRYAKSRRKFIKAGKHYIKIRRAGGNSATV